MTDNVGKEGVMLQLAVEKGIPYDQPLAITTTNMVRVSLEESFDSDVDEGTHAVAAFMANLSSTSGTNCATTRHVNEVHTDANTNLDIVNRLLITEMHQGRKPRLDVESGLMKFDFTYHLVPIDKRSSDVPTEVSSAPPGEDIMFFHLR
ncbi:hypothetical protein Tco_0209115 [Tanacetum coccineum]